ELTSSRIAGYNLVDLPPHPAWLDPWEDEANPGGFPLLSRQPRRFLHSQLAGTSLAGEPELLMHCDDARDQGFIDGMPVKVRSATGSTQMTLRTTSRCRRGVLAAENGPWFQGRDGLDPGGNPNAVTSDIATSSLSQATAAQTCRVWVEAV
ncbi:MAG: molybdopterin dinucleotide binding domain-containing protein, partial [Pseudomonadota bacterium]